jgi:hypothetical protein
MADALVTCIVLKPHVTLMDIVSTKMLGQFGFLVSGTWAWSDPTSSCCNDGTQQATTLASVQVRAAFCVCFCDTHHSQGASGPPAATTETQNLQKVSDLPCGAPLQATIFGIFQKQEVSVDVVATSEVSISLTLDPSKIWSRDLIDDELDGLVASFGEVAKVCMSVAWMSFWYDAHANAAPQCPSSVSDRLGRQAAVHRNWLHGLQSV